MTLLRYCLQQVRDRTDSEFPPLALDASLIGGLPPQERALAGGSAWGRTWDRVFASADDGVRNSGLDSAPECP